MKKLKNITMLATIAMVLVGGLASCEKKENTEPELTFDDLIALNLSKKGSYDPELLIGTWDIIRFAYTVDGIEISDIADLLTSKITGQPRKFTLRIPFAPTPTENTWENLWLLAGGGRLMYSTCTLSNNLITLTIRPQSGAFGPWDLEGHLVGIALLSSYSFVIIGDKLIIHFVAPEYHLEKYFRENTNLLILKKQ